MSGSTSVCISFPEQISEKHGRIFFILHILLLSKAIESLQLLKYAGLLETM